MASWIDRFAAMSVADRFQTIAEDPSTLDALLREVETLSNAATGILNMYGPPSEYGGVSREMWQRLADALDVKDLNGPAGGALVGQTVPAESTGASHVIPDGTYLCACTCGCVDRTIRPGRCMVCRVRESCLNDERVCEACEDGYRLASDGIHYDHNDSTWGVCRKVIAAIRMDRERKRARAEYP